MGAVDDAYGGGGGSIGSGLAGAAGLRLQAGRHGGCGWSQWHVTAGRRRLGWWSRARLTLWRPRGHGAGDEADNAAAEAGADGEEGEDARVDGMWYVAEVGAD